MRRACKKSFAEWLVKCIVLLVTARRLLLISVVRPTLEYGSEVWEVMQQR